MVVASKMLGSLGALKKLPNLFCQKFWQLAKKKWQKTSIVWNKLTFCFKFIICLLFHVEFSACCLGSIFIPSGPSQDLFKIQMHAEDFTRTIRTSCGESSSTIAGKYSRGPREIVENLVKVKFSHDLC